MAEQLSKTQANFVCSILALPVEIGRQLIQNIDSTADLHALSLSCKAFTEVARERIFAHIAFTLPFATRFSTPAQWGGVDMTRLLGLSKMVLQTKYIKCISVLTKSPVASNEIIFSRDMQEILAEWLRHMTRLEKLVIEDVNLFDCLIVAILDTSSRQPLSLQLRRCTFSVSLLQILDTPIDVPKLDIQSYVEPAYWTRPVDVYTVLERKSIAFAERLMSIARFSITTLRVDLNSPLALTKMLGSVSLPALRAFEWNALLYEDEQLPAVMDGFLQRHSTITSISLAGEEHGFIPSFSFPSLTQVSPSLPNLQVIKTTSNFIHKLAPGRPVMNISMTCVEPSGFHVGIQALRRSTATVVNVSLVFSEGNDTWDQVIESLAEATPSLQDLDLRTISPTYGTVHPTLAFQPLRFRTIARLRHLRHLNVDYTRTPSTAVLGMYPSSFIRSELETLRSTTLQEITVHGHRQSSRELLLCQFTQGSWFVRAGDTRFVVELVHNDL